MHKDRFELYQRVRICGDFEWAENTAGMIAEPPIHVIEGYEGLSRVVEMPAGPVVYYFVQFDSPQYTVVGDGPYPASEIREEYIIPL
jgi:hypothetical protein